MWSQVLTLLLWIPVVVVIHEAGHAVLARPAGFRLTSFGVGMGRPMLSHRGKGGVVYYVGRLFFTGGATVAIPNGLGRGPRAALYHAGGVLLQSMLGIALWMLPEMWWTRPVLEFNAMVILFNLVPWRVGGFASDGWWILGALGPRRAPAATGTHANRRPLERLMAFEQQAQSPVGIWYTRLMLAWTDLVVGKQPDGFFREQHDVPTLAPSLDALHVYVSSEWHRLAGRPLASLHVIRDARRAYGAALADDGSDLLTLAEAKAWVSIGEARMAHATLAQVAGVGGVIGDEANWIALHATLVDGDIDTIESAARRLAARIGGPFLDPPAAVMTLWEAAQHLADHDRREAADVLGRRAQRQAAKLVASADSGDRPTLIRRIGEAAGLRRSAGAVV